MKTCKASYTIAGVGGEPQVYTPENGGKIWTVKLRDNKGVLESIEAYGVSQVLIEPIGHGQLKSYRKKFPNIAAEVFDELPDKELESSLFAAAPAETLIEAVPVASGTFGRLAMAVDTGIQLLISFKVRLVILFLSTSST